MQQGQTPETLAQGEPAGDAKPQSKSIILFSDGTGNSSAKLFKTNVWRMYEAVDLGPPEPGERKQIAFYDDGVGTSGFKPLAILEGVFGRGLKRNVLDIYRYACRNYSPGADGAPKLEPGWVPGLNGIPDAGDEIYAFGFSRGAFTMRIAIAMIAKLGLVQSDNEEQLNRRSEEMYKVYRADYNPRVWESLGKWLRKVRGKTESEYKEARQRTLDAVRAKNFHPIIRFIGVWDTVAAYGGPVAEVTEAIDSWVIRLSMPNYKLADSVRCARHALSIDDERDAFHPLLWDELHEEELLAKPAPERTPWMVQERLEQVWFTGMHADVGGGYPDESLSYVSFLWMMEEAEYAGLRPVPTMLERFHALASSAGPIHNSRSGLGSYYRYQPRNIATWMEPIEDQLLVRRHPDLGRGLIRSVKLHESVAARIASGTDRYAPITLPACLEVVPPQRAGENSPPPTHSCSGKRPPLPLISKKLRDRFQDEAWNKARVEEMRPIWAIVGRRRIAYFISLFLTLTLVLMPIWDGWLAPPPVLSSGHGVAGQAIGLIGLLLPGFLTTIVGSWIDNPFWVLVLLATLVLSNGWATRLEQGLRDDTRRIWNRMVDLAETDAPQVNRQKPKGAKREAMRFLRWRLAPALIFAAMILFFLWLLLAVTTRFAVARYERGDRFCAVSAPVAETTASTFRFDTIGTCHSAKLMVRRNTRYIVEMFVNEPWRDGGHAADPRGLSASEIGVAGWLGVPFRRAVAANYLQPVSHIRGGDSGPAVQPLKLERGPMNHMWRGEFVADRTGALSLFANDSVLPFAIFGRQVEAFYTDAPGQNTGSAFVRITRAETVAAR